MKPLLRWAGSKKQLLHYLVRYWNNSFNRYIEPFAGSASLFFRILPQKAILSDLNSELINTYEQVKINPTEVIVELGKMNKSKEDYYKIRSLSCLSSSQQAARFIYLNNNCFNGLYRTNLKGQFNVPYGGQKSGRIISDKEIFEISEILKFVDFYCCDFEEIIKKANYGDFVYLDPPYRVNNESTFIEYGPVMFSANDLERLETCIELLNSKNISFVLSYIESPEGEKMAKSLIKTSISVKRNIAGFTKSPKIVNELIISNILIQ